MTTSGGWLQEPLRSDYTLIRGTWSTGFRFEHADGRAYGSPKTDGVASKKLADVFEILCSLGFRQTEARRMIDGARPHVGAETSTEDMVRLALRQGSVPGVAEERAEYLPVRGLEQRGAAPTWGHFQPAGESALEATEQRHGPRTVGPRSSSESSAERAASARP